MNPRPRPRRRAVWRLLLLVALLLGLAAASSPAAAAQGIPGMDTDCKEEPEPEYPGAGMVGYIDPPRDQPGPATSVYDEVGYAGLVWHTYDLGCMPNADKVNAPIDTWTGNQLFSVAKVLVGITNALHWTVSEGGLLSTLDDLIVQGSHAAYAGVFTPWSGVALLVLAVLMFGAIMRGDMATTARKTAAAGAALGLAAATYATPLLYTGIFDRLMVGGVEQIRGGILDASGVDAADALPDALHEQVVYRTWLAGEFGSPDNNQAKQLGRDLARAQAYTNTEVERGQTGEQAAEEKKKQYEQIAERTGETYPYFQGIAGSRVGAGAFAIAKAVTYSVFQAVTLAAVFMCQFLLRLLMIMGPVLGLMAIIREATLVELLRGVGTSLWHGLVLAAVSCLHLVILVWVTGSALSGFAQLLIMAVSTVLLWMVVRPIERFRSIFAGVGGVLGMEALSRQERLIRKLQKQHRRNSRSNRDNGQPWYRAFGVGTPQPDSTDANDGAAEPGSVYATATRGHRPGPSPAGLPGGGPIPIRPEGEPGTPAGSRNSRRWDGEPETERDGRFFNLRESGYRGPIDQDGNAADGGSRHRRVYATAQRRYARPHGAGPTSAADLHGSSPPAGITTGRPGLPPGADRGEPPARDSAEPAGDRYAASGDVIEGGLLRPSDQERGGAESDGGDQPPAKRAKSDAPSEPGGVTYYHPSWRRFVRADEIDNPPSQADRDQQPPHRHEGDD